MSDRAIKVTRQIASFLGKPELAVTLPPKNVIEKICTGGFVAVSVERLEEIAEKLEHLQRISCPTCEKYGRLCDP